MSQINIYEILKKNKEKKFTADELYKSLIAEDKDISKFTFYNNLKRIEKDPYIRSEKLKAFYDAEKKFIHYKKVWWYSNKTRKKSLKITNLKRFGKQAGNPPIYSIKNQKEHFLKLKREADEIKNQYQQFLYIKNNLKISIENWIKNAFKYEKQLSPLIEDLKILQLELK